jgi:peptidoglycan/LPS O-acetylase OafA/YrhL
LIAVLLRGEIFQMTKIRNDIQVLRGIAVLAVILFHSNSEVFSLGYLGVDIFFVISGFVIVPQISKFFSHDGKLIDIDEVKKFYKRRFYRLIPALASSLLFSGLVLYFFISPDYHSRISRQGIVSLFFLGNFGALIYSGDYFSPNPNPLIHMWSLGVEMQIYLFLPLLLIFLHKSKITWKISLIGCTIFSFIFFLNPFISELSLSALGFENEAQAAFYSPVDRFWQFAAGGILSIYPAQNFTKSKYLIYKQLSVLLLLFILLFELAGNNNFWSFFATIFTLLIISGRIFDRYTLNIFKYLGDRSYSIYLLHLPILSILQFSPVFEAHGDLVGYLGLLFGIILSVLLGSLNYTFVENRFRFRASQMLFVPASKYVNLIFFVLPLIMFIGTNSFSSRDTHKFNKEFGIATAPWEIDQECSVMSDSGPPCEYIIPGASKNVLLIGDSHAAQYSQVFKESAKKAGLNSIIWTHSSCPFQLENAVNKQVADNCIQQNLIKMEWIAQNTPEVVIVSNYLGNYSDIELIYRAILKIKSTGVKVVLIENNPVFPDKGKFGERLPVILKPYTPPKSFPLSEMNLAGDLASNTLVDLAMESGVEVINVNTIFCKFEICYRWLNGKWLYGDDNHLSLAGAKLVEPLFIELFESLKTKNF